MLFYCPPRVKSLVDLIAPHIFKYTFVSCRETHSLQEKRVQVISGQTQRVAITSWLLKLCIYFYFANAITPTTDIKNMIETYKVQPHVLSMCVLLHCLYIVGRIKYLNVAFAAATTAWA